MIATARLHNLLAAYTSGVGLSLYDADLASRDRWFCVDALRRVLTGLIASESQVTQADVLSFIPDEWRDTGTERARTIIRNIVKWS